MAGQLEVSKNKVDSLENQHREIKDNLENINDQLDNIGDLSEDIQTTKTLASESLKTGDDALASILARANKISDKTKTVYQVGLSVLTVSSPMIGYCNHS